MISIDHFLDELPRAALSRLRGRLEQSSGLVDHAKAKAQVREWALGSDRIHELWDGFDDTERTVLQSIYAQGGRGLSFEEIGLSLGTEERYRLTTIVDTLHWHCLAIKVSKPTPGLVAVAELLPTVLPLRDKAHPHPLDADNSYGIVQHLMRCAAWIKLGKIKLVTAGSPHRRSIQALAASFRSAGWWGEEAAECELESLFGRLGDAEWLLRWDDRLSLRENFKGFHSANDIVRHWIESWLAQCRTDSHWLRHLLSHFEKAQPTRHVQSLFGGDPDAPAIWHNLPPMLQDMWLLGLLSATIEEGRAVWWQMGHNGLAILGRQRFYEEKLQGFCTPNFDIHLPESAVGPWGYWFEMGCTLEKEDQVCRYSLHREQMLLALENGFDPAQTLAWSDELAFPKLVHTTVEQWMRSFHATSIQSALWIAVHESELLEKLKKLGVLDQFCIAITEQGLVARPDAENDLRTLLKSFGVHLPSRDEGKATAQSWNPFPSLRSQSLGSLSCNSETIDQQWREPVPAVSPVSALRQRRKKDQDFGHKIRLLEEAILSGQSVGTIQDDKRFPKSFLPVKINRQSSPIKVEIKTEGQDNAEWEISALPDLELL